MLEEFQEYDEEEEDGEEEEDRGTNASIASTCLKNHGL
jgi:hypothetical protein